MGIALDPDEMLSRLDRGIERARSGEPLPRIWIERVERLGEVGGVRGRGLTYIAALGGALLAKATDPEVDSLTQDEAAGPRGYSLRTATEFLTRNNRGRFSLGAEGPNPLNNSPFRGGPLRIDEFTKIKAAARPAFELFKDYVLEIARLGADDALAALAAFLRVRMGVADQERAARKEALKLVATDQVGDVIKAAEIFVVEDPEGGRRGQAFVAAVMDCFFSQVRLRGINDPGAGDVRVVDGENVILPIEVKQKTVDEQAGLDLAREAAAMKADKALLVVLAPRHRAIDRERVRRLGLDEYGVLVEVCESVREFVGSAAVFGGGRGLVVARSLPRNYALRMREHEVSPEGQRRWRDVIEARSI
jgi:SacI restriction endonuclease